MSSHLPPEVVAQTRLAVIALVLDLAQTPLGASSPVNDAKWGAVIDQLDRDQLAGLLIASTTLTAMLVRAGDTQHGLGLHATPRELLARLEEASRLMAGGV